MPDATVTAGSLAEPSALADGVPVGAPVCQRDIVVIGASAGGVEALTDLFGRLPQELPAAVFVVLHVMPGGTSVLPRILSRAGVLPVSAAVDGEPIQRGHVYVAPPDHHMLLQDDYVRLTAGPRENGHRPAIDPLFRSAARTQGRRVIGIVLSGALDDGSAGLRMIGETGGLTLVQDPAEALYPSMPAAALQYTPTARAVPLERLAEAICAGLDEPIDSDDDNPPQGVQDGKCAGEAAEPDRSDDDPKGGVLSAIACPECGGALWEHDDEGVPRFKCHVGHAYSADSLEISQAQSLEGALWAALRSLQERADLFRRLARRMRDTEPLEAKARTADGHAAVLRSLITSFGSEPGTAGETPRSDS